MEGVILRDWNCRWQSIDGHNDDGVDGLLFFQKGAELTGQIAYVQVKLRSKLTRKNGEIKISLGAKKIRKNGARWNKLVGATILIVVDLDSLEPYWVNLRTAEAFVGGSVVIPEKSRFDINAKLLVEELCGTLHKDQLYPLVATERADFAHLTGRDHIQVEARKLYHGLRDEPVVLLGSEKPVRFLRSGWRHITRKERANTARFQSLFLLGCVRRILGSTDADTLVLEGNRSKNGLRLFSTRRFVTFPFRQSAVVTVVLEENYDDLGRFFSFYTVYEPRRRRGALSVITSEQAALSK